MAGASDAMRCDALSRAGLGVSASSCVRCLRRSSNLVVTTTVLANCTCGSGLDLPLHVACFLAAHLTLVRQLSPPAPYPASTPSKLPRQPARDPLESRSARLPSN